jgi:hypothetical protein
MSKGVEPLSASMANCARSATNDFVPIAPATGKRATLSTEDFLKQTSVAICNATLNEKNFESPSLDFLAPEVITIHETTPVAHDKQQLIDDLRSMMQSMPDYRAEILSKTAVVDEAKGNATVYLHLFLNGMPDGIQRESVNVLEWKRKKGDWFIVRHAGMRGPPPCPHVQSDHDLGRSSIA